MFEDYKDWSKYKNFHISNIPDGIYFDNSMLSIITIKNNKFINKRDYSKSEHCLIYRGKNILIANLLAFNHIILKDFPELDARCILEKLILFSLLINIMQKKMVHI